MVVNFELVTVVQNCLRRDFVVADRTLIDPTNANPLMDGEFMNIDANYKIIRGINQSVGYALFAERGRYDVQTIGKSPILFMGGYEANTRVFTPGGITHGCALEISAAVSLDGTKSGLKVWAAGPIIGYVTRLPANNGGRLRFQQCLV